ncbi:MAG TPA: glycosyltransferase [Solirubrobacteraceae bacterium]|nr:glycosyltransferase [Solirubrobacteraceae bacterium]
MSAHALSVVVPTRDRPDALARCLAALARQTAPSLEVVVVDDASRDAAAVWAAVARACPRARVIRATGRGPAAARNTGVAAASGAIVCFTDDDCVPEPGWAARLQAACADGGAAAGTTVADPAAGRCAAAAQLLTHVLQVRSLGEDAALGFAPTCNLACAADLARALEFDESFPLAAGEDREWCDRLARAGELLTYVPDAVVVHRPQLGLSGLLRQGQRYGQGAVRFRQGGGGLAGGDYYRRLARECARAGAGVSALVVLAECAVAAGAAGELVRRTLGR